jgi:hypothetical protein
MRAKKPCGEDDRTGTSRKKNTSAGFERTKADLAFASERAFVLQDRLADPGMPVIDYSLQNSVAAE